MVFIQLFKRKSNLIKLSVKSDRNYQGSEGKRLKHMRIYYAKEKDGGDDLVNVDRIKNDKII